MTNDLDSNVVSTLIRAARNNCYEHQRQWLKQHDLDFYESFAQWVVVAEYVISNNGNRNDFDNECGLYNNAKSSDVRNTALHKLLDSRLREDFLKANPTITDQGAIELHVMRQRNNREVRKTHLREIRKLSRKIFGIWKIEARLLEKTYQKIDEREAVKRNRSVAVIRGESHCWI